MKSCNINIHKMYALKVLLLLVVSIFILHSCTEGPEEPVPLTNDELEIISEDELSDAAARIGRFYKAHDGSPIELSGVQNYFTYALKSRTVLQDGDNPCDVTLEFVDRKNIILNIVEYLNLPDGTTMIRPSMLEGKMTRAGIIKVSYPVPMIPETDIAITDIISGHTGCELYGPGIEQRTLVFIGYFNGERLKASAFFMSKCDVPWDTNDLFETPVDGPVQWRWTLDLKVKE